MTDIERIWLEPECCAESDTGRTWCQDPDNWDHDIDNEPGHDVPTEYVRADLYAELEAKNKQLKDGLLLLFAGLETDGLLIKRVLKGDIVAGDFIPWIEIDKERRND